MPSNEALLIIVNAELTIVLSKKLAELVAVYENLTAVQERCNELLEENRALKAKLA